MEQDVLYDIHSILRKKEYVYVLKNELALTSSQRICKIYLLILLADLPILIIQCEKNHLISANERFLADLFLVPQSLSMQLFSVLNNVGVNVSFIIGSESFV